MTLTSPPLPRADASANGSWPVWEPVYPEAPARRGALERRRRGRPLVVEIPVLVLAAFVIAFTVKTFFVQAFFIPSESMVPTLLIGDRVVVSRVSYRLHEPRRGDVVVFSSPFNLPHKAPSLPERFGRVFLQSFGLSQPKDEDFIKRVIGLPGDTVDAHGGHLYVDGRLLNEPYLPQGRTVGDFPPVLIPPHHLWVMGDNRGHSSDSRVFGPIDQSKIVGRAILRVWPPHRLAFL
jgi:signal peptidase I